MQNGRHNNFGGNSPKMFYSVGNFDEFWIRKSLSWNLSENYLVLFNTCCKNLWNSPNNFVG